MEHISTPEAGIPFLFRVGQNRPRAAQPAESGRPAASERPLMIALYPAAGRIAEPDNGTFRPL
jgi:hypothetical protein